MREFRLFHKDVGHSLLRGAALASVTVALTACGADFEVTSPGYFYSINGNSPNPILTLVRGKTYTFHISASSIHPFYINSPGVLSNNNTYSGTIGYTVPMAASNYNYYCSIHGFGAAIMTVAPPPPPPPSIHIVDFSVGSNLVVTSTGTNRWNVLPEYKTNLTATNWFGLAVITNRYANGTNETICGVPPGDPVFIRIRSQPN
jgi:hypothetical protein